MKAEKDKRCINIFLKHLKYIVSKTNVCYLLLSLIIAFVFTEYRGYFIDWYDENIIPILALFKSDVYIWAVTTISALFLLCMLTKRLKECYRFDSRILWFLSVVVIISSIYRWSGKYEYVEWMGCISYVDILNTLGLFYIIAGLINKGVCIYNLHPKKDDFSVEDSEFESLLNDWPIESETDDIFELKEEAGKIAQYICTAEKRKTWSLAITSPWGTGKTSFMNLIIEQLEVNHKKEFEFVLFNPRDCKSFQSIQEEFFNQIACTLAKYDSRCSNIIKDYMSALKLIDNRGVVEKFANLYSILDKTDLKERIKQSFASIKKKVVVLIDDFDRLSKDEIMEVLKLIDSNAAFNNLVFLTAYDKAQVNKSLGETNNTEDACFVDKFFNLEFSIPSRPYSYIAHYIVDMLSEKLNAEKSEKEQIKNAIMGKAPMFKENVPTMRDAKRYINQVLLDYKPVKGDVNVEEFLLVSILKYRYFEEYKKLYKKEYIHQGSLFADSSIYYLDENLKADEKVRALLGSLFPKDKDQVGNHFRHIREAQSFDNYFVNRIYSSLRIGDMKVIFNEEISKVYNKIDIWLKKEDSAKDIVDYLASFNMDEFNDSSSFIRFAEVVTFVAIKHPNSMAYWLFFRLIYLSNLEGYDRKYNLNLEKYKMTLLKIVLNKNIDPEYIMLRSIHTSYITGRMLDSDELIKDGDIWPVLKSTFLGYVSKQNDEQKKLSWLYDCAESMIPESRRIILDKECASAYKIYIAKHPKWYITHFVRLGMSPINDEYNSVACEPFWEQIFGSVDELIKFIDSCASKNIKGASVAKNFIPIYLANNKKPIEFSNQGNVQEKIDNRLGNEYKMYEKLKKIQAFLETIPDSADGLSVEDKTRNLELLNTKLEELSKIQLYIILNGDIHREIERKIQVMK